MSQLNKLINRLSKDTILYYNRKEINLILKYLKELKHIKDIEKEKTNWERIKENE